MTVKLERKKSQNAVEVLNKHLPGGVNSPVRSGRSVEQLPMVVDHAVEDTLIDVDGHHYLDFCCSWGALILGHAHPQVINGLRDRMSKGTTFGISCEIEGRLAAEVLKLMPNLEKIRFVSSGTEATMSAARLARGATGRDVIVKFSGCYHGHADLFLVQAGSGVLSLNRRSSSAGIPEDTVKNTVCLPFNDIQAAESFLLSPENKKRIAAVIVEPIAGNIGVVPAEPAFLKFLREATQAIGALLIFDETITGFRVGLDGAQGLYKIKPDITCLGKILGGGLPAAAFGGSEALMDHLAPIGEVYQAGTLSGNPLAMEAGYQTLKLIQQPGFYQELERKANLILSPLREHIEKNELAACVQQVGSMFTLFFGKRHVKNLEEAKQLDTKRYAQFFQHCFNRGVYLPPSQHEAWFVSAAHNDKHLKKSLEVMLSGLS